MKLFHYLSEKYALEALRNQRIKIVSFESLNYPFELLSISLGDPEIRRVMKETKKRLSSKIRLLSYSKTRNNALLWGHYADKHKGVALEFDIPVRFDTDMMEINAAMFSTTTKLSSWPNVPIVEIRT